MSKYVKTTDAGETVGVSDFVRRQTAASEFSHYTPLISSKFGNSYEEQLVGKVCANYQSAKAGYRDGVILVPVSPSGFYSSVITLKEGDKLAGEYKRRQPNEDPRKKTWVVRGEDTEKLPAESVDIVLYHLDVLKETNEETPGLETDWEIISINASPTEGEMPIATGALIANHLQLSGGTATNMTDKEFVKLLRKSVEFWKDKALLAQKE